MEIYLMFPIPQKDFNKVDLKNNKMQITVGSLNGILTGQTTGAVFDVECVDNQRGIFHASYSVQGKPRECQQKAKIITQIAQEQFGVKVHAEVYK
jgi:hypothetical protein